MQTTQTNVRFGLTLANFRRFESIIQAAVLSYPQPVEVDWSQSDLRFTTYIARLRDAIRYARENQGLLVGNYSSLSALVVRPHPTNHSRILIGDHEATKTQVSLVQGEATPTLLSVLGGNFQSERDSRPYPPIEQAQAKLRLSTSADPEMLQRAVVAYAELASMKVEGLPKFHLERTEGEFLALDVALKEWTDGYDVAVQETEKEFIIL